MRLTHDAERFPHFIARAGAVGTVVEIDNEGIFAVHFDEPIEGAETWSNEVHWYPASGYDSDRPELYLEPLAKVEQGETQSAGDDEPPVGTWEA